MDDLWWRRRWSAVGQWAERHETMVMAAIVATLVVVGGLLSVVWRWIEPVFRANLIWLAILGVISPVGALLLTPGPDREKAPSNVWLMCFFVGLSVFIASLWIVAFWMWSALFG